MLGSVYAILASLSFRSVDGLSRELGAVFLPDCERSPSASLRPYEKVGHQQLQTCLFLSVSRCLHGFVRVMHTIWRETSDVAFALLLSACIIQISVPRSQVHQEAVVHPHSFVGAHVDGILVSQQSDSSMMQACTHTRFVSSWISGNEHSSTHRPLSFIIFARLYLRDISMLSVVFSNVTMPLHRKVRLQHEAAAETMSTKADVACSHEARY